MEFKGTKGEWLVSKRSSVVVQTFKRSIANAGGYQDKNIVETSIENDANAKLIAAAPDLLKVCVTAMAMCNSLLNDMSIELNKAINKALK